MERRVAKQSARSRQETHRGARESEEEGERQRGRGQVGQSAERQVQGCMLAGLAARFWGPLLSLPNKHGNTFYPGLRILCWT